MGEVGEVKDKGITYPFCSCKNEV